MRRVLGVGKGLAIDHSSMSSTPKRSAGVLRSIAVLKWLKAAGLVALGVGLLHPNSRTLVSGIAHALRSPVLDRVASSVFDWLGSLTPAARGLIDLGTFVYAALFAVEGVGLWMGKRWAEWLTVITTSLLIPVEIYEIAHKPSWERATLFVINVAIVVYLVLRMRHTHRDSRS